jgi:hypothetical protein
MAQSRDIATPMPGPESLAATLHLLPPPLLQLLPPPQLLLPPLLLPHEPQLPPPELLLLSQDPQLLLLVLLLLPHEPQLLLLPQESLLPPLLLPQPSLDELELLPQPLLPLLPPPLEVQALQLPPQPRWSLELEHALSHDSELLQLGPVQSQLGEAVQLLLLLSQPLPQLTEVERGGPGGGSPPSTPGNGSSGAP